MGPTGPNSSSCGGLVVWPMQGLAALASITITEKTKCGLFVLKISFRTLKLPSNSIFEEKTFQQNSKFLLKINVKQTNISTDQNSFSTENN